MTDHQPDRPWEAEPAGPEQAAAERRGNAGCLGAVGLILVLAVSCGVAVATGDGDDEPSLDAIHYDVERVCEEFVEKRLKAPSTAEFDTSVTGSGPEYTAAGTVDSENSFGAMVRNDYSCTVRDSGDRWTLVNLTGLED